MLLKTWLVLAIIFGLAIGNCKVLAQVDKNFSIGQDKPLTIEWLEFEQGFRLRIQNTSKKTIPHLAARLKPADGFSDSDLKIVSTTEEPCETKQKKVCGYVIGEIYELLPRSSNNFLIKLGNISKIPSHSINFDITVNDSEFTSIHRLITINPPILQTDVDLKTINIETPQVLNLDLFGILNSDFFRPVLFSGDSLKKLCGKNLLASNYCITNAQFSGIQDKFYPNNFSEVSFQKKAGAGQNIHAKIEWDEKDKQIFLNFSDIKTNIYEQGEYTAKIDRLFGPKRQPIEVTLQVCSHWLVTFLLIFFGLFLALFLRILQGSPLEKLLHRIDNAKLNFIDTAGFASFRQDHGYDIRRAVFLQASKLISEIQKFREANPGSVTAATPGFTDLEKAVTEYEKLPEHWYTFMANLDYLKSQKTTHSNSNGSGVTQSSKTITLNGLTAFFTDVDARFQAIQLLVQNANGQPKGRFLFKKMWIIFIASIIIVGIFLYRVLYPGDQLSVFLETVLILCFITVLMSWLWTRVIWMIGWYWMMFLNFISPRKVMGLPSVSINWWDTLPVFVAISVALINGMSEFYFQSPTTTPILHQLFLIAWGFGSTTAVQALFAILERSPLGRYF